MSKKSAATLERLCAKWSRGFNAFMGHLDRMGVPYLSHSKVACLTRCPRCYYRQYVLGEKPDSAALRMGIIFHKAAKKFYKSKSLSTPTRLFGGLKTHRLQPDEVAKVQNAITLLVENRWPGFEVTSVEEPFFMDLAPDLPPIIGVADLVLHKGKTAMVVDHKTSQRFNEHDHGQLVLYAEHVRRRHGSRNIDGFIDEYRLVPNLAKIRIPAFRRTPAEVGRKFLSPLIRRYRNAWVQMRECKEGGEPTPDFDCWICNSRS